MSRFDAKNIYYFEGLYLDEKSFNELNIQTTTGVSILALFQQYPRIYQLESGNIVEKMNFNISKYTSNENLNKPVYYVIKNNRLILIPIITKYAIFSGDQLLFSYSDQKVRDIKLNAIKAKKFDEVMMEMVAESNNPDSVEFTKQQQLRKVYSSLDRINK